jgi:hypothetical protein
MKKKLFGELIMSDPTQEEIEKLEQEIRETADDMNGGSVPIDSPTPFCYVHAYAPYFRLRSYDEEDWEFFLSGKFRTVPQAEWPKASWFKKRIAEEERRLSAYRFSEKEIALLEKEVDVKIHVANVNVSARPFALTNYDESDWGFFISGDYREASLEDYPKESEKGDSADEREQRISNYRFTRKDNFRLQQNVESRISEVFWHDADGLDKYWPFDLMNYSEEDWGFFFFGAFLRVPPEEWPRSRKQKAENDH